MFLDVLNGDFDLLECSEVFFWCEGKDGDLLRVWYFYLRFFFVNDLEVEWLFYCIVLGEV